LEQEKKILLPQVEIPLYYRRNLTISDAILIEFDEIFLETRLDDIVPDVLIRVGERLLMIEIWVTHKIDDAKRKKIEDAGISTIEINLSNENRMIGMDDMRKILLDNVEYKQWVYNKVAMDYKERWLSACNVKKTITRGLALHVDGCPISARVWHGKPYANVRDDCFICASLVEIVHFNERMDYSYDEEFLYCCGTTKIQTISELKEYLRRAACK